MGARYFGAKVLRSEDPRLITGHGRYLDDIELPGMLHAAFVRSEHAHARIKGIDTAAAKAVDGVHAVLTSSDLGTAYSDKPMVPVYPSPLIKQPILPHALAKDEVNFAGQAVVLIIAESRSIAEDAAMRVVVDYEALPAIIDCAKALNPDAPKAHSRASNNLIAELRNAFGDIDAAFADAPHSFKCEFRQHRGGCHAMECRGVIAIDDPYNDGLTVYTSTQAPYLVRKGLARWLEDDENRIRVIAPDVGGGFGPKAGLYAEELVIPLAARIIGRPIKWAEDRREHFTATNQQGDQWWSLEVAAEEDGKIRGVRGRVIGDNGAFIPYGLLLSFTTINPLPGPYAIPALDVKMDVVFTNTTCNSPVRGAGRPNAAYAMERMIETVARGLKLDPAEVRRRNFIRADQFPYQPGHKMPSGAPITYDSGDFHGCLDKALELADYAGFKERQAAARKEGRYLGIGVSSCIEDTGLLPFEGATVRVQPSGKVMIQTGAAAQGQGHRTFASQIVADELGVDIEDIAYHSADTGIFPHGVGTVGSRVAVTLGTAVHGAAQGVRKKALALASMLLQTPEENLELEGGVVRVKGSPGTNVALKDLAQQLSPLTGSMLPKGFAPGLEATSYDAPTGIAYASGSNIAEVEVDIGTGEVKVLRYSVAHDCGKMINPMLVDGQIIGGVVHGIGNALFERMHYDEAGQPLSTNYGEYLLPLATEMPRIDITHQETPSPLNPLGVKGAGEGGTIPAANAVIAAVENALEPWGIVVNSYPAEPQRICELLDEADARMSEQEKTALPA